MFSATKEILLKSQITELGYYKRSRRKLLDVNVSDSGLSDAEAFLLKLFAAAEKGASYSLGRDERKSAAKRYQCK